MRRDNGAGSVHFEHKTGTSCRDEHYHKGCTGRWSASISMGRDGNGKRSRARLVAPTKTELLRKVSEAQAAIETGLEVSGHYTVSDALDTFLAVGLEGLAPRTVQLQEFNVKLLKAQLGAYRLRDPSAAQVRDGLVAIARDHATRSVALCKNTLERAIRLAQAEERVGAMSPRSSRRLRARRPAGPARRSAWSRCWRSWKPRWASGTWTPTST